jgi:oxygen-independent coproporphyrinogen III oxidase
VIDAARNTGFRSISLDLIYGLPHQTPTSFAETLDKVIAVNPDRLSVFNYAHMPKLFKTQRQIKTEDIPSPEIKLEILQQSIEQLIKAGYVYIGMDHFAKPDDELAIAQRENKLYRNFQGYSTHAECDLIGLGITSIGSVGDAYSQNQKTLDEYDQSLQGDELPVFRGVSLNEDDKIRRTVITRLICHFSLDIIAIEKELDLQFADYFAKELLALEQFVTDGLIKLSPTIIEVLPAGHLLIRNICMVFDHYIQQKTENNFSKVI